MPGEKYFRSAVMGYQKEDVLSYIEQQNNALSEMRQSLDASLKAAAKAENDRLRQIEELSGKISELTEEINRLKAENQSLAGELAEARLREQTLEGQLVVAENIAAQKSAEIEESQRRHALELSERDRSEQEKLSQLKQKLEGLEAQHQQQIEEVRREYEARINSLTDEIVAVRGDLSRSRAQLDEASQRQSGASLALKRINELNAQLGDKASALASAGDSAAEAVERLADALSVLSEAVRGVRENAEAILAVDMPKDDDR